MHTLYESTYELLHFKNLLVGLGIGLAVWTAEGLAFYLVLRGLNVAGSFNLALVAIFTLSLGSILGGMSNLPGGLGAAEASMTGLLQVLVVQSENVAAIATLLIRFFTLWFGVGLGILTVIIWRKTFLGGMSTKFILTPNAASKNLDTGTEFIEAELAYEKTG